MGSQTGEEIGKAGEELFREKLTSEQFRILREHGTERAGTSPLNYEKRDGLYHCAACGNALFKSDAKYESGSGWPSFYAPIEGAVQTLADNSLFMRRIEVQCAQCKSHLGHVFPDGPQPTGERYCMNGLALDFDPAGP
ncbi:peptide-methionine (R)-S-oxide reductase MsrB [Lichenicoccus sp.]|uniref:peptide-methionine (R)-S-oxide reductase MsrB n=1 Tax=Lichenicoccus sp. TaxID=2781899 RepID=UPI003D0E5B7F